MYILPAHPVQIQALDSTGQNRFNVFETKTQSAHYRFLQNELMKHLELGKTALIVIPDDADVEVVPKLMSNFKMSRLCLVVNEDKPLSSKLHAQIKALSKVEKSNYKLKNYEVAKTNAHKSNQKLNLSYSLLNRAIFGNRSWSYIATNNNFYSYHDEVSLLKQKIEYSQFQFNQSEYWLMRGRIEEARKIYKSEFEFIGTFDKLNVKALVEGSLNKIKKHLNDFSKECQALNFQFSRFIDEYSRQFYNAGLNEIESINSKLKALQYKINEHEVRYGIDQDIQSNLQEKIKERLSASFKEKMDSRKQLRSLTNELVEAFKDSQKYSLDIQLISKEDITVSFAKEVCNKATENIHHWREAVTNYKNHSLRQINLLNSEIGNIGELDKRFQSLLENINLTKIFREEFEDNTFNILKKIEFVSSIKTQIDQAFWLIENHPDYIAWKSVTEKYPVEVHRFLEGLKHFKTSRWTILFDRFYIEEITNQNFHPDIPVNYKPVENYLENLQKYREEVVHWINHLWDKKRMKSAQLLQAGNKKIYAQLIKKNKSIELSTFDLLKEIPEFLQNYYPVMIMKMSLFRNLKVNKNQEWDFIWGLNIREPDEDLLNSINQNSRKFVYLNNEELKENESELLKSFYKLTELSTFRLDVDYADLLTPFKLMQKSEILPAARKMASMLSFSKQGMRVFQLKEMSILSFLSDQNNEKMFQILDHRGIKELIGVDKNELDLVDVLIDFERDVVIVTQDGLFDTEHIESAEWQFLQLKQLQNLGAKWINIWTSSYYYEDGDVLQVAFRKLIPSLESQQTDVVGVSK